MYTVKLLFFLFGGVGVGGGGGVGGGLVMLQYPTGRQVMIKNK